MYNKRYKFAEAPQQGGANPPLTSDDIDQIYKTIKPPNELGDTSTYGQKLVNTTYGEMLFPGMQTLIEASNMGPSDIFYDLGSGNGKAVMQAYANGNVKRAYGVEFHTDRYHTAEQALRELYKKRPDLLEGDRLITYQLQNIKDLEHLDKATVIYMCSTCYPDELMEVVYTKIKDGNNIRCIITHKQYDKFGQLLPNIKTVNVPCTWNPKLDWYVYTK